MPVKVEKAESDDIVEERRRLKESIAKLQNAQGAMEGIHVRVQGSGYHYIMIMVRVTWRQENPFTFPLHLIRHLHLHSQPYLVVLLA